MSVQNHRIFTHTTEKTDIIDLTPQVTQAAEESHIDNGFVILFVPGSTAALTTIEFESGVINDLKEAINRSPGDISTPIQLRARPLERLGILTCEHYCRTLSYEALCSGKTDSCCATGDNSHLVLKLLRHCFRPLLLIC